MPPMEKEKPTARRSFWIRALICVVALGALLGGVLLYQFVQFAETIATIEQPEDPNAQGLVVLTGGTDRVEKAIRLLSEGRAERLLISGVHPVTTRKQIIALTSADRHLFECCVDLDRIALNTEGNAVETALWAKQHDYKTLLLVTSAYHLPRAQLELMEMLPNVQLIPYPVFSRDLDLRHWYWHRRTIKLLIREFVKYTFARTRISIKSIFVSPGDGNAS